tara:strand:+ start:412 stop:537 length:126 start_codon:yes stop_codon:yes gene_type:complete
MTIFPYLFPVQFNHWWQWAALAVIILAAIASRIYIDRRHPR